MVLPGTVLLGGDRRLLLGEIVSEPLDRVLRDVQPELGAAPQDVLGGARPFAADEVVDFGRRETAAELLPEIRHGAGLAQDLMDPRPVGAADAPGQRLRGERIARPELAQEALGI